jgi:CheY-like chemotaxis protein
MNGNSNPPYPRPINILLVDDDAGDILMTRKALENGKIFNTLNCACDGVEALAYLRRQGEFAGASRPDLVVLDLNMPRMDGRELLSEMKQDAELRSIPTVVFTTSDSEQDISNMYKLQANCYITKPIDLEQFAKIVREIKSFWFTVVKLPV